MKPILPAKIITVPKYGRPSKKQLWGNAKFKNCCYCGVSMPIADCTREHLIAASAGGTVITACCLECNREKGCMQLIDYIIYLWKVLPGLRDRKQIRRTEVKIRNATKFILILFPGEYDFIFK